MSMLITYLNFIKNLVKLINGIKRISLSLCAFIFIVLLQGCTTATVLGTAAAGIKVATDPRTIGKQIDDNILAIRINHELSKNEKIRKEARINAIVYQNTVLLIGQSPNIHLTSNARWIAMHVEGVDRIYNEVRQSKPVNFETMFLDTWITVKVRSKLISSKQIKSSNIKIKTENGEVFLLGLVTEKEGKQAAEIVSHISGVKHVITVFDYIED